MGLVTRVAAIGKVLGVSIMSICKLEGCVRVAVGRYLGALITTRVLVAGLTHVLNHRGTAHIHSVDRSL